MWNKVQKFIAEHHLLDKERRYLVALSGGADSVSLLLLLHRLDYKIDAVHCNFKLRGTESDRDEQFCSSLCSRYDIPMHCVHFDTREYASLKKISIEMAARELRYHYFEQLRKDIDADGICVGHHQEDSVETFLLNLVRGTGIHGLTGIAPRNGKILRPLLCCTRKDIETFLNGVGEHYVTDSSNLKTDVIRNKLRLQVIPLLKEINPSIQASIIQTETYLSEAEIVANNAVAHCFQTFDISYDKLNACRQLSVPLEALKTFPSKAYFLFELLAPLGFNSEQISAIAAHKEDAVGNIWQSQQYELTIDAKSIIIRKKALNTVINKKFPDIGLYSIDTNYSIRLSFVNSITVTKAELCSNPFTVYIDAANIKFPFTLRNVAQGDKFIPFGMKGSKLVSDYLTNLKKNRFQKRDQLLLTDAIGMPLWLVGLRIDNRVRFTNQSKKVLKIEFLEDFNK